MARTYNPPNKRFMPAMDAAIIRLISEEKLTFREAAQRMSVEFGQVYNRNMLIGRWHRLKGQQEMPAIPVKPRMTKKLVKIHSPEITLAKSPQRAKPKPTFEALVRLPLLNNGGAFGCGIAEVTGCRFPITPDKVQRDGHKFCNHATRHGKPYCDAHYRVAYRGIEPANKPHAV